MRQLYHRDMVGKLLNNGDYVAWASPRQGYGMRIAKVESFTPRMVWIILVETGERKRCRNHHLLVITKQLLDNRENGTEVDLDLPAEGRDLRTAGMVAGQSARSWFESNGIDIDAYLEELEERDNNE
jgi:hypothetical protein